LFQDQVEITPGDGCVGARVAAIHQGWSDIYNGDNIDTAFVGHTLERGLQPAPAVVTALSNKWRQVIQRNREFLTLCISITLYA
jgi:hypothetical protein